MKIDLKELKQIILQEVESGRLDDLALNVLSDPKEIRLILYEISSLIVVGEISIDATKSPCIPKTYQVNGISVDQEYQGTGLGFLLYKMAMFVANRKGAGLTSDQSISTSPKATEFWQRLKSKGSIAKKRSTGEGTPKNPHDTFDYEGDLTPDDPNDDCDRPMDKPATVHSWELKPETFKETGEFYSKLAQNHFIFLTSYEYNKFIERLPAELEKNFDSYLTLMAGRLFSKEYSRYIRESRIRQIINEELQVVLTNEEAAEMFGEDILEILDEEENNPWAICTASVGRENKDKYEKCVMGIKKQNKER